MNQLTILGTAFPTPVESCILTKAELAQALRMSPRSLEGLLKSGQLPPGERRGRFLYWHASVAKKWNERKFAAQLKWAKD